jgi:hypothetical protein
MAPAASLVRQSVQFGIVSEETIVKLSKNSVPLRQDLIALKTNRTAWERASYFDDLYHNGAVIVPRHKWIYLADQSNMCAAVDRAWLEHWRDYVDDQTATFRTVIAGSMVFLWLQERQERKPTTLE